MLRIHEPKELFNHLIRRASLGGSLVLLLVCFLAQPLPASGQCTAPSFAPATNLAAGDGPELMAVGDFNGDGKRDLAVPNWNADTVTILLGNGAGNFTSAGSFPVGHNPTSAAAGDFNGDGKLDLAVVNYGSFGFGDMSILIGTGTGSFGPPTSYRVIAFNNSVTVSDLNNDGKLDIVASVYSEGHGIVQVLMGDGTGGFSAASGFGGSGDGYSAVVADFNGDGKGDVAIAKDMEFVGNTFDWGTHISVLLGDGSGNLGAATDYTVGTGPFGISVSDLNGDGKLDLAVANGVSDNVSVLLGNGVGGFGAATNFAAQDFPNSVAAGDFNGDGKPDLAVSNASSGTVSVLLGNGAGSFSAPTNFAVGTQPVWVVLSDFNSDNKSDLAIANLGSDNVSVLLNTCAGAPANPIDDPSFFVRQHYTDFLNRTPDASGLDFWTHQISDCGSDQACIEVKRINVSAAFFLSIEFQETGYLVERLYKCSYGDATGASTIGGNHQLPVPIVRFNEFLPDTQQIGQGVIVGQAGWEQVLENNKQAFIAAFVQRSRFTTAYPQSITAAQFVDTLNTNAGGVLSQAEHDQLVADLSSGAKSRAQVLRAIAEDADLSSAEKNPAFVLAQYFGYLRRNPNDLPDSDYSGYDFWLTKLNQFNGNFVNAEMVKAFITSGEYRGRFGP